MTNETFEKITDLMVSSLSAMKMRQLTPTGLFARTDDAMQESILRNCVLRAIGDMEVTVVSDPAAYVGMTCPTYGYLNDGKIEKLGARALGKLFEAARDAVK